MEPQDKDSSGFFYSGIFFDDPEFQTVETPDSWYTGDEIEQSQKAIIESKREGLGRSVQEIEAIEKQKEAQESAKQKLLLNEEPGPWDQEETKEHKLTEQTYLNMTNMPYNRPSYTLREETGGETFTRNLLRLDSDIFNQMKVYFRHNSAYTLDEFISYKKKNKSWKDELKSGIIISRIKKDLKDDKLGLTYLPVSRPQIDVPPRKGELSLAAKTLRSNRIGVMDMKSRIHLPWFDHNQVKEAKYRVKSDGVFKDLVFRGQYLHFNNLGMIELNKKTPVFFNSYQVYNYDKAFEHAVKLIISYCVFNLYPQDGPERKSFFDAPDKRLHLADNPELIAKMLIKMYDLFDELQNIKNKYYMGAASVKYQISRLVQVRTIQDKVKGFDVFYRGKPGEYFPYDYVKGPKEYHPLNHRFFYQLKGNCPVLISQELIHPGSVAELKNMPRREPLPFSIYTFNPKSNSGPIFSSYSTVVVREDNISLGTDVTFVTSWFIKVMKDLLQGVSVADIVAQNEWMKLCYMKKKIEIYKTSKETVRNIYVYSSVVQLLANAVTSGATTYMPNFLNHRTSRDLTGISLAHGGMDRIICHASYEALRKGHYSMFYSDNLYLTVSQQDQSVVWLSLDGSKMEASSNRHTAKWFFDRVYQEQWGGTFMEPVLDFKQLHTVMSGYGVVPSKFSELQDITSPAYSMVPQSLRAEAFVAINDILNSHEVYKHISAPYILFLRDLLPLITCNPTAILESYQIPLGHLGSGAPCTAILNGDLMSNVAYMLDNLVNINNKQIDLSGEGVPTVVDEAATMCGVVLTMEMNTLLEPYKTGIYPLDLLGCDLVRIKCKGRYISLPALNRDRLLRSTLYHKIAQRQQPTSYVHQFLKFVVVNCLICIGGWAYGEICEPLLLEAKLIANDLVSVAHKEIKRGELENVFESLMDEGVSILDEKTKLSIYNRTLTHAYYTLYDVVKLFGWDEHIEVKQGGHTVTKFSYNDLRTYFQYYRDSSRFPLDTYKIHSVMTKYSVNYPYPEFKEIKFEDDGDGIVKTFSSHIKPLVEFMPVVFSGSELKGELKYGDLVKEGGYMNAGDTLVKGDREVKVSYSGRICHLGHRIIYYEPVPKDAITFLRYGNADFNKTKDELMIISLGLIYLQETMDIEGEVHLLIKKPDHVLFYEEFKDKKGYERFFPTVIDEQKVPELPPHEPGPIRKKKEPTVIPVETKINDDVGPEYQGDLATETEFSPLPELEFKPMGVSGPKVGHQAKLEGYKVLELMRKKSDFLLDWNPVERPNYFDSMSGNLKISQKDLTNARDFFRYAVFKHLGGGLDDYMQYVRQAQQGTFNFPLINRIKYKKAPWLVFQGVKPNHQISNKTPVINFKKLNDEIVQIDAAAKQKKARLKEIKFDKDFKQKKGYRPEPRTQTGRGHRSAQSHHSEKWVAPVDEREEYKQEESRSHEQINRQVTEDYMSQIMRLDKSNPNYAEELSRLTDLMRDSYVGKKRKE